MFRTHQSKPTPTRTALVLRPPREPSALSASFGPFRHEARKAADATGSGIDHRVVIYRSPNLPEDTTAYPLWSDTRTVDEFLCPGAPRAATTGPQMG